MSRSNHCYYNISRWDRKTGQQVEIKPVRRIEGRRPWTRKKRMPEYSIKSWHFGPSSEWDKAQSRRARAIQRAEQMRNPDDPMITDRKRLINLWDWF